MAHANIQAAKSSNIPRFWPSYLFINFDYFLRWLALAAFRFGAINVIAFWICQILIIPFVVVFLLAWRREKVKAKYGAESIKKGNIEATAGFGSISN